MNICAQRAGQEGGRGRGCAQGESGAESPSALPGHRVTENPKCLVPSAEREWQALGKEGCTKSSRCGVSPDPVPEPKEPKGRSGKVGSGSQKASLPSHLDLRLGQNRPQCFPSHPTWRQEVALALYQPPGSPPLCAANPTLVIMPNLYLPRSFCTRGACSVTCPFLADFSECQLCARPTQSPRPHQLPGPAKSLRTVGGRMQVSQLEAESYALYWLCPRQWLLNQDQANALGPD